MKCLDNLINSALLGTSNKSPDFSLWPKIVFDFAETIYNSDNCCVEDAFYKTSAIALSYYRSGFLAKKVDDFVPFNNPEPETKKYMSNSLANNFLLSIKNGENIIFNYVSMVLKHRELIIPPFFIPYFLKFFLSNKSIATFQYRSQIWPLLGNRGKWLADSINLTDIQWATAKHSQRLAIFKSLRLINNIFSIKYLQRDWNFETTEHKNDFLNSISIVFDNDLLVLENFYVNEKSKSVKNTLAKLLSFREDSSITQYYNQVLNSIISFSKTIGFCIENYSENDKFSDYLKSINIQDIRILYPKIFIQDDKQFAIFHLCNIVSLDFWESYVDGNIELAIKFIEKSKFFSFKIDLISIIKKFRNSEWAFYYCKIKHTIIPSFVDFIDIQNLEILSSVANFNNITIIDDIFKNSLNINNLQRWDINFSTKVLYHALYNKCVTPNNENAQYLSIKLSSDTLYYIQDFCDNFMGNSPITNFAILIKRYLNLSLSFWKN
ncbi:MAG: DUF5691 domain-containing protein [Bacteroidales bacterium]|nr:DUF5691 domain-containing protein [Bacteroidales bacterium]